mmetsp:Transcript_15893/g.21280  ORF Transcript_15893/g.21280 Transcript_15893/m.21280 type:complete len:159 (+) Transcript_15893:315-791(+)
MNREKPGSPFPYRAYVAVSNFHQAFSNILCFLSLTFVSGLPPVASLSLYNNQLEGAIPTEFGLLTNMVFFRLENNELNGTVPRELGNLSKINKLSLFGNFINDVIDTEDPLCVAVRSSMSTLAVDCNMVECACCCRFSNLRNCGCCDERDTCGDLGQR